MKTAIMISILLFLTACGNTSQKESSITPPQPTVTNEDIKPPASPTLE